MYGAPSVLWPAEVVDSPRPAVSPAARKRQANDNRNNVRDFDSLPGGVRLSGALSSKAARALHRAALETNCRTGSGSIHRRNNAWRRL
jgi:hypothetical protein